MGPLRRRGVEDVVHSAHAQAPGTAGAGLKGVRWRGRRRARPGAVLAKRRPQALQRVRRPAGPALLTGVSVAGHVAQDQKLIAGTVEERAGIGWKSGRDEGRGWKRVVGSDATTVVEW